MVRTPVVERHADPVDHVVTRIVRRVRVVGHGQAAVVIGVERIEVCRARMRPVAPAGERIAATVVRRPHHRSQRRPAVDCFGDPAEGGDVGWRLLGPRVPRPVHLVSEPHEDGDTATVEDGQPGGEGGRDRCGDSRQTGPRLQGEQQHPAGAGDLSGSLLDVLPRGGVEGQRHEDDVDRRCVAQPAGVVRDPVVAPVQADAEPHPGGWDQSPAVLAGVAVERCRPHRRTGRRAGSRDAHQQDRRHHDLAHPHPAHAHAIDIRSADLSQRPLKDSR